MAAIILLLMLMPQSIAAEASPLWTVNEVFEMQELNQLPDHFQMTYVDPKGNDHRIVWTKNANLDEIVLREYDAESQSMSTSNWGYGQYIGTIQDNQEQFIAQMNTYPQETQILLSSNSMGNVFIAKKHGQPVAYSGEAPYIARHTNHTECNPTHVEAPLIEQRGGTETCKKVYLSVSADYDLFVQFGRSTTAVASYVHSVLATVQAIYRLEEIQIGISEIIVHNKEDGFRHWTALDDLNFFRFIRRSFSGDIAICLGGFKDGSGFAPLGGHAFLSSLCLRSTSYAYVNVDGSHLSYPNYSWDIFATAHELGHVLGSEHTHACVWGPHGNEPLDNCAPPEGLCSPGPSVSKGTIMSYCHLPGQPGVSFANGFGKEPGDRIRSKIAQAPCLSDYIPTTPMVKRSGVIRANMECFDGSMTHYYFDNNTSTESDDILVMSIDKKGQDIGHVYDGSLKVESYYTSNVNLKKGTKITAPYVGSGKDFYVAQKYWKITPKSQPSNAVEIDIPFLSSDLTDLQRSAGHIVQPKDVTVVSMKNPANPDPRTNHRNATSSNVDKFPWGGRSSVTAFKYVTKGSYHHFTFQTKKLHGGGLGVYPSPALPVDLIQFDASRQEDHVEVTWETAWEQDVDYFEIQRSKDGKVFEAIGLVMANNEASEYVFRDFDASVSGAYYRLLSRDFNGSEETSNTIFVEGDTKLAKSINVTSTLVRYYIKLEVPFEWDQAEWQIFDVKGVSVSANKLKPGSSSIILPDRVVSGVYFIRFTTGNQSSVPIQFTVIR